MHNLHETIKMDRMRRVPVSGTPVAFGRSDLVSRNVPNPEAQLGRGRGQAHALFACPQPRKRTSQPHPIDQQTSDEDPAKPGEAPGCNDVPPVLLPKGRLAKPERAVGRQICFGAPPSPQLPPVKLRLPRFLWRGLDIAGRRSTKDLRGDLGGLPAQCVDRKERSPHNAAAQLIVVLSEYRSD